MTSSEDLVIGDVVDLRPGDKIPADLRVILSNGLKVDNSTLTGESEPQPRYINCTHFNPWETANLAFFPTVVMEGRGRGVVIRTGDDMVMGRIASLAETIDRPETPISKEVLHFIHVVTTLSVGIGAIMFCVSLAFGQHWLNAIILLIGLMVANAPEGILTTVMVSVVASSAGWATKGAHTVPWVLVLILGMEGCIVLNFQVCLGLAAKKMAKKNCIVKHLEAVETLGSVTTICADKTGTLTCNKMTISSIWYDRKTISTEDLVPGGSIADLINVSDPVMTALLRAAALCNNATFAPDQVGSLLHCIWSPLHVLSGLPTHPEPTSLRRPN